MPTSFDSRMLQDAPIQQYNTMYEPSSHPGSKKNTANGSLQILKVGLNFDPTDTASQQQWDWSLDKNGKPKQMGDAAISGSKWNMT